MLTSIEPGNFRVASEYFHDYATASPLNNAISTVKTLTTANVDGPVQWLRKKMHSGGLTNECFV